MVAGAFCGLAIHGVTGQALAIGLVTLGLGAALLLVFFEVGLSEDRARAREDQRRRERACRHVERPQRRLRRWPRRPG